MVSRKPIIYLKNICKNYKMGQTNVRALCNVDLAIYKGEFVAIQGPSGSGKSTMVNMVGCLDTPSMGKIFLDGYDISKMSESELAQVRGKKIGFVFQNFNLIGTLTAFENVMLPMTFQGVPYEDRAERAEKLLSAFGLSNRMNHKPTQLSGGEQQRVAIARALANDPEVLLADEPTGNLDSKAGMEVMGFLQQLHKQGKTIVMVTHDDKLANYAERIIYLKDGRVVKSKINKQYK